MAKSSPAKKKAKAVEAKQQKQTPSLKPAKVVDETLSLAPAGAVVKKGTKAAPDLIYVDKYVKRSVAGLAFWPGDRIKGTFIGIKAWVEAKCPDQAYIYDTVDNLEACNISPCDVQTVRGLMVRRAPRKPSPTRVNIAYAVPGAAPTIKKVIDRIQDADTKEHHVLNYG